MDVLRQPLSDALSAPVRFAIPAEGWPGTDWRLGDFGPGEVVLLENIRFYPGEEANDPAFSQALADLGDVYINDAFSVSHRAHASTVGVARLLPAAAGRQMEAELTALEKALSAPERPVIAVVGGAKVSSKLELLSNLIEKSRPDHHRWRHGQHLPGSTGQSGRQVTVRA